jgi:uncharacterized repeat protein (TIGR03803 family)
MKMTWFGRKTRMTPPLGTPQPLKSIVVQACAFIPALLVSAQSFNQLKSFPTVALDPSSGLYTNSDGAYPQAQLTLAGATLYGAAPVAGSAGSGTIFKINTNGSGFAVLRSLAAAAVNSATQQLTNSDGAQPRSRLLVAGGTVYGTALYGGTLGNGTLFKVGTNGGDFTVLRTFANGPSDGANPHGNLVLASSGLLYGTTELGGTGGGGIAYRIDTNGSNFAIVHHFGYSAANGAQPMAGVLLSGDTLYGTTYSGGSSGWGTVFSLDTTVSNFTLLKSFPAPNPPDFSGTNIGGHRPRAPLELAAGRLYGTTTYGGASSNGTVFAVSTNGADFAVLHNFSALPPSPYGWGTNTDGANSLGNLVVLGNKVYGTTQYGGETGSGTIFKVNTNGSNFSVIRTFSQDNGGGGISAAGLLLSGATFYGSTQNGGDAYAGTLFSLAVPGPQLSITRAGTNVILSWPSDDLGFTLQSTPNLGPSAIWSSNPPPPVVVNNRYTVTNAVSGGVRFYRLSP